MKHKTVKLALLIMLTVFTIIDLVYLPIKFFLTFNQYEFITTLLCTTIMTETILSVFLINYTSKFIEQYRKEKANGNRNNADSNLHNSSNSHQEND